MKFRKYIVVNDFHLPFVDEIALDLFKEFLKEEKPNRLIIAGDLIDCQEISTFNKIPKGGNELQKNFDQAKNLLAEFRNLIGRNAKIDFIEGNHDFRIKKYLIMRAPELVGLRALRIEKLLGLEKLKINFYPVKEEANKFQDNYIRIENIYVGHFDTARKGSGMTARSLLADKGVSVIQAHNHRMALITQRQMDGKLLVAVENGCLCSLNPTYIANPDWQLGWSVIFHNINNHRIYIYPILLGRNYEFFWGNTEYSIQ